MGMDRILPIRASVREACAGPRPEDASVGERPCAAEGRDPANVARRIWGSPDAIMLIFAGSAAEFAVNKAVDWLFWTNALPNAPIERFFETVRFAQAIVFGDEAAAQAAIELVNRAHKGVERARGGRIPQWAYRDVLFMLIDYGERAHALVFGPMTPEERLWHFESSLAIGRGMHIEGLPGSYDEYVAERSAHLRDHTERSHLTGLLYARYRQHLGSVRMRALLDLQASLVPDRVATLLGLQPMPRVERLLRAYRHIRNPRLLRYLYRFCLPHPNGSYLAALERPVS